MHSVGLVEAAAGGNGLAECRLSILFEKNLSLLYAGNF